MTLRNAFENCLIELNKVQAPSLLVDDFIYLFNKSVQQYVNKRYNLFETKQQLTDDLRVLTKTVKITSPDLSIENSGNIFGQSYRCKLPNDYVHMLNCICEFEQTNSKCEDKSTFQQGANKLDTSQWSHIINNAYMKPSAKRPYYYIINIENPDKNDIISDDDKKKVQKDPSTGDYIRTGVRYGNSVQPIMQIKCGNDIKYRLKSVYIDYLRAPEYLTLDQDILDDVVDNSQVIEFPDYVVYEIINEVVKLVMENGQNPRIQTNPPVNQTVA